MMTVEYRFWPKVNVSGPDECWNWLASCTGPGYGQFWVNGELVGAHRVSYEIANGPIPHGDGYHGTCVCHRCDNRLCVNPAHLFLSDQLGNLADMVIKGRGKVKTKGIRGERHCRATLTDHQVYLIRKVHSLNVLTQQTIGDLFGIQRSSVNNIIKYRSRAHIT